MKNSFLTFVVSFVATTSIYTNNLQDDLRQRCINMVPCYTQAVEKQHGLIRNAVFGLWELFFTDLEKETLRNNPDTKEFLCKFYALEIEARGMGFCYECLTKKHDPTVQDLQTCYEQYIESDDRKKTFDTAKSNEWNLKYNRELRSACHQGDAKLRENIEDLIQKHSQEQSINQ